MRTTLDRKLFLSLLLPLFALACDSSDGSGSGGAGGGSGGSGGSSGDTSTQTAMSGGGGSGGTAPMECEGPGYEGNEPDVAIGTLVANLVDQNGQPAAMTSAQVCGTDICLAETTSASGAVTVAANQTLKKPAFKYGDGIVYSKLAILLPEGDSTFTDLVISKLPDIGDGDAFAAGQSVASAGVVIDIPSGGAVEVDGLIYPEDIDQVFRAAAIPVMAGDPALDPALGLDAVWGAAPVETVFCPPAKLHIPNTPQYAAGADVEVYIQGLDALQHWAPYGEWLKVSDAKVSADGSEIVTVDGQGLPVLSTFAVRLK